MEKDWTEMGTVRYELWMNVKSNVWKESVASDFLFYSKKIWIFPLIANVMMTLAIGRV